MVHKELLFEILESWTEQQLTTYINKLEARQLILSHTIKELKEVRRKRTKKQPLETGARDGR